MAGMRMGSWARARRESARAEVWCGARVMRMRAIQVLLYGVGGSGFPHRSGEMWGTRELVLSG